MGFVEKDKFHCARKEKYHVFVLEMSSSELTDISVCAVMLYSRRLSTLGFARLHPTVLTRDSVSLRMGRIEQGDSGGKKAKEKEKIEKRKEKIEDSLGGEGSRRKDTRKKRPGK